VLVAAEPGNADAQTKLGRLYYKGQGVLQDYVMAHMYLNIAVANGSKEGAGLREVVFERLTPSQIAEAQKLAREWMKKHQ